MLKVNRSAWLICIPIAVFAACCAHNIQLPGLYWDEINPDVYVVSLWLKLTEGRSPPSIATIAGWHWPLISTYYIGMLPVYLTAPLHALLGYSVTTVRIIHALFGAGILALVYLIVYRVTGRSWAAFCGAILLALDAGFILSFRTQWYITLQALPFFLGAILIVIDDRSRRKPLHIFIAGALYGIACWTHLTVAFFGGGFIVAWLVFRKEIRLPKAATFACGVAIGMLPWAISVLRIFISYNSYYEFLHSFDSAVYYNMAFSERLSGIAHNLWAALANAAQPWSVTWLTEAVTAAPLKGYLTIALPALAAPIIWLRGNSAERDTATVLYGCIVSFLAVSPFVGDRIHQWHFNEIVPLLYAIFAISLPAWARLIGPYSYLASSAALIVMTWMSFTQQSALHEALQRTGGSAHFSEWRTKLPAEVAAIDKRAVVYAPGFGYSFEFAYLLGGQVNVYHKLDYDHMIRTLCDSRTVIVPIDARIPEREAYIKIVESLKRPIEWRRYHERNGPLNTEMAIIRPERDTAPQMECRS